MSAIFSNGRGKEGGRAKAAGRAKESGYLGDKLEQAILHIDRNPKLVKSITSFRHIAKSF